MSEHLNNEELALELTKIYADHMNHNVDIKRDKTMMDAHGIASSYQVMLKAVQNSTSYFRKSKSNNE